MRRIFKFSLTNFYVHVSNVLCQGGRIKVFARSTIQTISAVFVGLVVVFAVLWAQAQEAKKAGPVIPPVVTPGVHGTPNKVGTPPSDAVVLFDGTNFDQWESSKKDGEVKWKLVDGAMEVVKGGGSLRTRKKLGYGQYHIEWRTPPEVKGSGQGRGNSGVFPLGGPEVQVLDSYDNSTYTHGQAGAIYNRYPPLVNACRPPGVWQTYDIIVHAPIVAADGKVTRKSAYTVLHNGVLI